MKVPVVSVLCRARERLWPRSPTVGQISFSHLHIFVPSHIWQKHCWLWRKASWKSRNLIIYSLIRLPTNFRVSHYNQTISIKIRIPAFWLAYGLNILHIILINFCYIRKVNFQQSPFMSSHQHRPRLQRSYIPCCRKLQRIIVALSSFIPYHLFIQASITSDLTE